MVTSEAVHVQGQPVRLVARLYDEDDLWVLLANTEGDDDEGVLLHAGHLLDADPRLTELADMAPGTVAIRHVLDGPWVFRRFRRNEDYDRMLTSGEFQPFIPYPAFDGSPDVERDQG